MRPSRWWLVVASPAALAACAGVLGIDEFTNGPTGSGTATASVTGTGSGTGSSTGTAAGGQGGAGAWSCDLSLAFTSEDGEINAAALGVTPNDDIALAGDFSGTVDWGDGPVTAVPPNETDGYVVVLDRSGVYRWKRMLSASDMQRASALATDRSSNVIVGGAFRAWSMDVGGKHLSNSGAQDLFVLAFDSLGEVQWGMSAGQGEFDQELRGLAADGQQNVYATGSFRGEGGAEVDFGGSDRSSENDDIFVVRWAANGAHQWDVDLSQYGDDAGEDVAADANGDIVMVGWFESWLFHQGDSAGEQDAVVIKLASETGEYEWYRIYGDAQEDRALAVATDGTDIVVAGLFRNQITFEEGDAGAALGSHGATDAFVLRLDTDGNHLWSRSFGGRGLDVAYDVAIGADRQVIVAGVASGVVDFGDAVRTTSDEQEDAFVVALDPDDGHTLWSRIFGSAGVQEARGVAVDSRGGVVLHGNFVGTIDFGCGPLTSTPSSTDAGASSQDVFVARLAPSW